MRVGWQVCIMFFLSMDRVVRFTFSLAISGLEISFQGMIVLIFFIAKIPYLLGQKSNVTQKHNAQG